MTTDRRTEDASAFYGRRGLRLVRGAGCTVQDAEGRSYLDATSMYGTASLGHASPVIADALTRQAQALASCFASFDCPPREELIARLHRIAPGFSDVFLCNSGTEAIEAALKVARFATGRPGVLVANGGFHGRTLGSLSGTHVEAGPGPFAPLLSGFRAVPFGNLDAVAAALDPSIGLVLLEPVQGEGGVRLLPEGFLAHVVRLAHANGSLVAFDEVQTGVGRTGHWFAHQAAACVPDLLTTAKGLGGGVPIGALLIGPRAGDLDGFRHGSTFGGNPLAAAAACATLEAIEDGGLLEHVRSLGAHLERRLNELGSPLVRHVRVAGLLAGIELRVRAAPLVRALQERGVLVLTAGPRVLRLLPPLTITRAELDRVVDTLGTILTER